MKTTIPQSATEFTKEATRKYAENKVDCLLSERQATHGDFSENARIAQYLRTFYRSCPGWEQLTYVQREALDMNALKDSRILSGQGSFVDHWDDKAGYSRLAAIEARTMVKYPNGEPK